MRGSAMRSIEISDGAYLRLKALKRSGESFSQVIERIGSNSMPRLNLIQRVCIVLWGYCLAVWLYVIVFQFRYPDSIYDALAWWLPIRMDYLGEAAFVASFIFALITALHRTAQH
jgi:hypothetical protein